MWVKKQQLEPCMEHLIDSRSRKEYNKTFCCLPVCLIYAQHIMRNAGLDELQVRIKIVKRNISNLRYVDDTTYSMAGSEEELKSLLMKVKKERERASLKLNIKKKLRLWHPAPLLHGK